MALQKMIELVPNNQKILYQRTQISLLIKRDPMTDTPEKKIIILHNFKRTDYVKLMASLESTGLSSQTIVAVTTPVTLGWKLDDLLKELLLEDDNIRKEKGK